jgi:hypothetical protein
MGEEEKRGEEGDTKEKKEKKERGFCSCLPAGPLEFAAWGVSSPHLCPVPTRPTNDTLPETTCALCLSYCFLHGGSPFPIIFLSLLSSLSSLLVIPGPLHCPCHNIS